MIRTSSVSRNFLRLGALLLGGLFLALLSGCKVAEVFNLSGPQSTMVTEGPVAKAQWDLFMITVYVTTFIFVVVGAILAYAQVKFHAKDQNTSAPPPEQGHGNPFVELGLIIGSIALLVIIAIPTLRDIWYTHDVPEAEKANAMDVTATGYQWWFKFEYTGVPTKDAKGNDGADLVTGNELVVPVGKPVRVHLRTVDVIHSFWIPKLSGKVDMIPNRANFLWFKADKAGYFYGQCAEYCGDSHAIMRFRVIALNQADYDSWLASQRKPARTAPASTAQANALKVEFASMKNTSPGDNFAGDAAFEADPFAAWKKLQDIPLREDSAAIARGRKLFNEKTCVTCHTIRGHEGVGVAGPDLTHLGSRSSIAAGILENSPERLGQWIKHPDFFKPGNKMYYGGYVDAKTKEHKFTLNDEEIAALVAYLQSLK